MPDRATLHKTAKHYLIWQHYLNHTLGPDAEERIRMEIGEGGIEYTHTIKYGIGLKRTEIEVSISAQAFKDLQSRLDFTSAPIIKERYRFLCANQLFEVDIYPDWQEHAILEVELRSEDDEVVAPPFLQVIKEVTGDAAYSNRALSRLIATGRANN